MSRDPIGENGGIGLYVFCGNGSPNYVDYLGRQRMNAANGDVQQGAQGNDRFKQYVKWRIEVWYRAPSVWSRPRMRRLYKWTDPGNNVSHDVPLTWDLKTGLFRLCMPWKVALIRAVAEPTKIKNVYQSFLNGNQQGDEADSRLWSGEGGGIRDANTKLRYRPAVRFDDTIRSRDSGVWHEMWGAILMTQGHRGNVYMQRVFDYGVFHHALKGRTSTIAVGGKVKVLNDDSFYDDVSVFSKFKIRLTK